MEDASLIEWTEFSHLQLEFMPTHVLNAEQVCKRLAAIKNGRS